MEPMEVTSGVSLCKGAGGAGRANVKRATAALSQDDFLLFQIEFVPELPKTITGKIKRKELRIKEFSQRSATKSGASL